jgi:hypothetical protein
MTVPDVEHSYWYQRIMLNFAVSNTALSRRLPPGWSPAARAGGSNVTAGFCEVWNDEPAEFSSYLYVPVNGVAQHDDGRSANMRYLTVSDRPSAIGGCSVLTATAAEHTVTTRSRDGELVTSERYRFSCASGELFMEIEFTRGGFPLLVAGMDVLCPDDPTYARRYENEELNLMLRGPAAKVDRVRSLKYRVTVGELADLFDGSERLMSVASIPTSKRVVQRQD